MDKNELPKGFEHFDTEREQVPFVSIDGRKLIGWHIINVYDINDYASSYMIRLHQTRLARLKGSQLAFGSPTFHYEQDEAGDDRYPGMYGLYHIEGDCVTSLDLELIQDGVRHQGLESLAQNRPEKLS